MRIRPQPARVDAGAFDPAALLRDGKKCRLRLWLLNRPWFMGLGRYIRILRTPIWLIRIFRLPCLAWITRYDDVREALSQPHIFQSPFRTKMKTLEPEGCPFFLGLDGGPDYEHPVKAVMQSFPLDDIQKIERIAKEAANRAVGKSNGKDFDAITDLIADVPLQVYREYYGLDTAHPDFARWLFAMSDYIFRAIGPNDVARPAAIAAAKNIMQAADTAIAEARAGRKQDTVAERLIRFQDKARPHRCPVLTNQALRTTFIGMISGYIPVSTMAGCHILEILLKRPAAMAEAVKAVRADNDALLTRCLLEALRLYPINPGPWRICAEDYTFVSAGGLCRHIPKGTRVLVGTQSAMRDRRWVRDPEGFNPNRDQSESMVFGFGLHWCAGAPLAIAEMTQTFKALLRHSPVCRARRTKYFGVVPNSLIVKFKK